MNYGNSDGAFMSSRSFPEMNSSITCLERSRKTWLHNQQFFSSNRFLCTKRLPKALASCAARPKSMSLIFNEPIARFSLDKFLHGLEGSLWGCRKPIPTKCWLLETSPSDRDACRWKHAPTCAFPLICRSRMSYDTWVWNLQFHPRSSCAPTSVYPSRGIFIVI